MSLTTKLITEAVREGIMRSSQLATDSMNSLLVEATIDATQRSSYTPEEKSAITAQAHADMEAHLEQVLV